MGQPPDKFMGTILEFLQRLNDHGVQFVVIGGVAAILHGSATTTEDLDVCAPLDEPNLVRIQAALRGLHPKFRMSPRLPPLFEDVKDLVGFRNLNLITDWGVLDILGEVTGVGAYGEVLKESVEVKLDDSSVRILKLPALIQAKTAANRPKDRGIIPVLKFMQEHARKNP